MRCISDDILKMYHGCWEDHVSVYSWQTTHHRKVELDKPLLYSLGYVKSKRNDEVTHYASLYLRGDILVVSLNDRRYILAKNVRRVQIVEERVIVFQYNDGILAIIADVFTSVEIIPVMVGPVRDYQLLCDKERYMVYFIDEENIVHRAWMNMTGEVNILPSSNRRAQALAVQRRNNKYHLTTIDEQRLITDLLPPPQLAAINALYFAVRLCGEGRTEILPIILYPR